MKPSARYLINNEAINVALRYDARHPFKRKSRFATTIVSGLCRLSALGLTRVFDLTVVGSFPEEGCVAVSFHETYLDSAFVALLHSRLTPVTSALCQSLPFNRWFLTNYGVIWTGRDALQQGAEVARAKGICWLAPFGFARSRHGTKFKKARSGAARIAILAERPVVCITVKRNAQPPRSKRKQYEIRIGAPIYPKQGEGYAKFTERYVAALEAARAK